jgi:hypothetical protein
MPGALDDMIREAQKLVMSTGFGSSLFKTDASGSKKWTNVQLYRTFSRLAQSPIPGAVPQKVRSSGHYVLMLCFNILPRLGYFA